MGITVPGSLWNLQPEQSTTVGNKLQSFRLSVLKVLFLVDQRSEINPYPFVSGAHILKSE